ncbi:DUF3284 domain-containing protein, partial [Enterococcus faecalis]
MEITKTLTVSADEFYTQLMSSVIFDIRKQTGKTLTRTYYVYYVVGG